MCGLSLNTARDGLGHIRLQEGFVEQNKRYGVDQQLEVPSPQTSEGRTIDSNQRRRKRAFGSQPVQGALRPESSSAHSVEPKSSGPIQYPVQAVPQGTGDSQSRPIQARERSPHAAACSILSIGISPRIPQSANQDGVDGRKSQRRRRRAGDATSNIGKRYSPGGRGSA